MDIKKSQNNIEQAISMKKAQMFVTDIKSEIRNVTWTQRDELILYTKIVVLTTLLFGLTIYGLDLSIQTVLSGLSFILHTIIG
ncbi:MAG: preprotein translocase subunit SecE [Parachlamydiaceae bacterium]|nr:preprotein translocase subunit SecE [Parachlamydiaceae bacterium]